MSEEIEYIEPTQEHVGQVVEVMDNEQHAWKAARLTGIQAVDEPWRAIVKLGDKRFVYELSSLRVKE